MATDDFDFGFSLVDADELEAVQVVRAQVEQTTNEALSTQEKVDTLFNMIMPLLNHLQANPEKEYIYWPNRVERVEAFRDKLSAVYNA